MIREDGDENERLRVAAELDADCADLMRAWEAGGTVDTDVLAQLFVRSAAHHARFNVPFRRYAQSLGCNLDTIRSWREIPAVPASVFKQTRVAAFPAGREKLEFHTSGTTQTERGRHFMENAELYEIAARAAFHRLVLAPRGLTRGAFTLLSLAPDSLNFSHSSLGYMVDYLMREYNGHEYNFVRGTEIRADDFSAAVAAASQQARPLCIFGTALGIAECLAQSSVAQLPLPAGSCIIETGGFKGRASEMTRAELYQKIAAFFAVAETDIIAELGMTELSSQYYDEHPILTREPRIKIGPPWLLTRFLDSSGQEVADGERGRIAHTDLANRGSVMTVLTEDEGYRSGAGFVFLGRAPQSPPRGCSLTVDERALPRPT